MAEVKVPEVWYKAQRALRSAIQFLVVAVPTFNLLAVAAAEYLKSQVDVVVPGWVFVWLNAAIALSALLVGLFARLMAVPGVNDWFTKWLNLGSVPKSALVTVRDVGTGKVESVGVVVDPKLVAADDTRDSYRDRNFPE